MKYILSFILLASLVLCSVCNAFALSDADYKKYMQESPNFAQADKSLGEAWKAIKAANAGKVPKTLLLDQQNWIKRVRDMQAEQLFSQMSHADAYAEVTNKRVQMLRMAYLRELPAQAAQAKPEQSQVNAGDISGKYKYGDDDLGGEITIKNIGDNEYSVELASFSTHQNSCFTEFQGTAKLVDDVLIVTNQENVQDSEWVNGKLVEKGTSRLIRGTLKIYTTKHPDVLKAASSGEDHWGLSKMGNTQIAIIEDPIFTEGQDPTPLSFFSGVSFYREGASGGPGVMGVYTKSAK